MRQNKKAALALCAATAAAFVFFPSRAVPDEPAMINSEEASIETSEPSTPTELSEASEQSQSELRPALICLIGAEFDNLATFAIPNSSIALPSDEIIVGVASYYQEPQQTASGEQFDPDGFTAAAQLEIRDRFGGIKYGRLYQPAYAVVEYESKKVILKFNDVGPLRPGRKFDLSRAAMAYFGGLEKGLLTDVKVRPLPLGQVFTAGPVSDAQLAALGVGNNAPGVATAQAAMAPEPDTIEPETTGSSSAQPVGDFGFPSTSEIVGPLDLSEG
jgi:rare lipoprotein A (peptidoglycan hydrolase)